MFENEIATTERRDIQETIIYHSIDPTKRHYQLSFEKFLSEKHLQLSEKAILEYIESEKKSKTTGKNKNLKTFVIILQSIESLIDLNMDLKETQRLKLHKSIGQLKKRYEVKTEKAIKREDILSIEEIRKLIDYLENKDAGKKDNAGNKDMLKYKKLSLIVECLYETGCRISELINIKLSDLTLSQSGKFYSVNVIGKGKKERSTPKLPVNLYKRIKKLFGCKDNNDLLFPNMQGKLYDRHNVFRELKEIGKEAIGKEIYNHIFRHSRASHLYEKTKDPKLVQEYLGHSSIKTTLDMYVFMDLNKKEKELETGL